ncbi:hypothetical protein FNJ84_13385 [Paracoccus sp. M683]|uniref:hypothetical protein n=1 Tax=Paracoccus sp. M683 TaxID=2594268 RepID=UPI00117CACCC|nr:hypothetical protein [Paracoccus sp. M683]TRW96272.1 hypothetical protein FNJ84_13385 [Paracoccus sp. M683]
MSDEKQTPNAGAKVYDQPQPQPQPHIPFNPTAQSMAYEQRGELPTSFDTAFYRDAGLAKEEFLSGLRGPDLLASRDAAKTADRAVGGRTPKTPTAALPDPHPSFALPNRKLYEENWFAKLEQRADGRAVTRAETEAMQASKTAERGRKPRMRSR